MAPKALTLAAAYLFFEFDFDPGAAAPRAYFGDDHGAALPALAPSVGFRLPAYGTSFGRRRLSRRKQHTLPATRQPQRDSQALLYTIRNADCRRSSLSPATERRPERISKRRPT